MNNYNKEINFISRLEEIVLEAKKNPINSDEYYINSVIELLYKKTNGNLLPIFLTIDNIYKNESKDKELILRNGLHQCIIDLSLIIEKSGKSLKELIKELFENEENSFSHLLPIAMAYFTNGINKGEGSKKLHDIFIDLLKKHGKNFINNKNLWWTKEFGYHEYIKSCLKNLKNQE